MSTVGAAPVQRLMDELDGLLADRGVWGNHRPTGLFGRLVVLGAPHNPHSWKPLRDAFIAFLTEAEELRGPMSEMALRLFGATEETRGQLLGVRERAVGEVVWDGKTVTLEAVRRRRGRRYVILETVAQALYDAEVEARQKHGSPSHSQ